MFIFLDIDGVLNDKKTRSGPRILRSEPFWQIEDIDLEKIKILNEIIEETDANVILHSSWGKNWSKPYLIDFFNHVGLCKPLYDVTEGIFRIIEIKNKIKALNIDQFVVIDDFDLKDNFKANHFHTDYDIGLLIEHINPIIDILNRKINPKDFEITRNEMIEIEGGKDDCPHSFGFCQDTGKLICRHCDGYY